MSFKKVNYIFLIEIIFTVIVAKYEYAVALSQKFECLYDECYCINEMNAGLNETEISIVCLAQNVDQTLSTKRPSMPTKSVRIKTFQIYNYNLKSLPANLFANMSIEYLAMDLKGVQLLEESSFANINSLTHLAMYHLNAFEARFLADHVIDNLVSLSIELSELATLDSLEKDLISCKNLNQLILSHNKLTSFDSKLLAQMEHLETLKLNNNLLESVTFDVEMPALKHLILSSNKLKYLQEHTFKNLKNLILLDLFENELKSIEANAFVNAKSLFYLYLGNNYLSTLPNVTVASRLKQLDLRNQHGILMRSECDMFSFVSENNNQLTVYLDQFYVEQNVAYEWLLHANRPIVIETTSFDLSLKNLEMLFRNYLRKVENFSGESSYNMNKNYLIYRLLSQQTVSLFDLNYFTSTYQIDYAFNVTNTIYDTHEHLVCNLTEYIGDFNISKTRLFCVNKLKSAVPAEFIRLKSLSQTLKLKSEKKDIVDKLFMAPKVSGGIHCFNQTGFANYLVLLVTVYIFKSYF